MNSILINPKDEKELLFISQLLTKMGVNSKILSEEEKEDLGLSIMMREVDRNTRVAEDEIIYKLKK
ncbi:MAG: hypothetical protein HWE21_18580 [Cytophagia bacterium]|nr:hypothetical protein [Cytophagia bacterium]NVK86341.1 hypothetical protein [Cytophagia bacterium]